MDCYFVWRLPFAIGVFLGGPWRPPSPIDGSRTRCCHHTMLKARVRALAVVTVNYLGSTKTD